MAAYPPDLKLSSERRSWRNGDRQNGGAKKARRIRGRLSGSGSGSDLGSGRSAEENYDMMSDLSIAR